MVNAHLDSPPTPATLDNDDDVDVDGVNVLPVNYSTQSNRVVNANGHPSPDLGCDDYVPNGAPAAAAYGDLVRVNNAVIGRQRMDAEKRVRREIANSNERRRMESINAGFQGLRALLPKREGDKISKASILQQTVDFIRMLLEEKCRLAAENEQYRRLLDPNGAGAAPTVVPVPTAGSTGSVCSTESSSSHSPQSNHGTANSSTSSSPKASHQRLADSMQPPKKRKRYIHHESTESSGSSDDGASSSSSSGQLKAEMDDAATLALAASAAAQAAVQQKKAAQAAAAQKQQQQQQVLDVKPLLAAAAAAQQQQQQQHQQHGTNQPTALPPQPQQEFDVMQHQMLEMRLALDREQRLRLLVEEQLRQQQINRLQQQQQQTVTTRLPTAAINQQQQQQQVAAANLLAEYPNLALNIANSMGLAHPQPIKPPTLESLVGLNAVAAAAAVSSAAGGPQQPVVPNKQSLEVIVEAIRHLEGEQLFVDTGAGVLPRALIEQMQQQQQQQQQQLQGQFMPPTQLMPPKIGGN